MLFFHEISTSATWRSLHEQRNFFDCLAKKLNFFSLEDWYRITESQIVGGPELTPKSKKAFSLLKDLVSAYPEHDWKIWRFQVVPNRFWNDPYQRRSFFDWLGLKLGYFSFECWYRVSGSDIKRHKGSGLLSHRYNGSIYNALKDVYPEFPWIPWRSNVLPINFWPDYFQRKSFLDWLGNELGYVSLDCWYGISLTEIRRYGGLGFIKSAYNGSVYSAVVDLYPAYDWIPWKFNKVPKYFWKNSIRRRWFFDWLGRELGYTSFECWYRVSLSEIESQGGSMVLSHYYANSIYSALSDIFPEFPWVPWRFNRTTKNFWSELKNHKDFILELGKILGFYDYQDFYRLKMNDILSHGGSRFIMKSYSGSMYRCLSSVFPEFNWSSRKFPKPPRKSIAPRTFDSSVFEQISVKHLSDWYRMPLSRVKQFGIYNKKELFQALKLKYPDFNWNSKFRTGRKKILQWKLRSLLEKILEKNYPEILLFEDYWGFEDSVQRTMELDIFVPALNLAFEYQGLHHFRDHHFFGPSRDYKLKDERKRVICKRVGITLIEVPYDLMMDEASVTDLVRKFRPDLINIWV